MFSSSRRSRHSFTLLEMCTVLLIIMILLAATMPAIQSVFVEQAVRNDSRQLALMVRTGMLQSDDQHRAYIMELTSTTLDLHPVSEAPGEDGGSAQDAAPPSVEASSKLDSLNKLVVPDPKKAGSWVAMPATSWLFRPGELCPASQVRLIRGKAWLELKFNALTGDVENESAYFP